MSEGAAAADGPPEIKDLDQLKAHLQAAIELELTTIPPYLVALYSIRSGTNAESSDIIQSVVMEEMLHMALAANVLNAVGGTPRVADAEVVPTYPATLPVGRATPVTVDLRRFSPEAIATFLEVEYPKQPTPAVAAAAAAKAGPLAQYLSGPGQLAKAIRQGEIYASIGDFYEAIRKGLDRVEAEEQANGKTIFTGDPARQLPEDAYPDGGKLFVVTDLPTAQAAIKEIVDQGEGYGDTIGDGDDVLSGDPFDVAHYYRFNQIARSHKYGPGDKPDDDPSGAELTIDYGDAAVWPMIDNPTPEQYADPALVAQSNAFDATYTSLLKGLHQAFDGDPAAIGDAVDAMWDLRRGAKALIATPIAGGAGNAGPAFRYVPG